MIKLISNLVVVTIIMSACTNNEKLPVIEVTYPKTEKIPVINNYFGTEVIDNYRWLEDDRSEQTAQWVKSQNETTNGYLNQIPFRSVIRERFDALANYESYSYIRSEYRLSLPIKKNGKIYYFKNSGLQNQGILYALDPTTGEEKPVIDPNTFSKDGTTSISDLVFSPSGKYIAYSISEGGSDWRKIFVIDAETLEQVEKEIVDAKFTGINWQGEDGFYYSAYDKPKGSELSAMTDQHKLYYHQIGTPQKKDILVFGKNNEKRRYVGVTTQEESDFVFLSAAQSTSGNELYLKSFVSSKAPSIKLVDNFDNDFEVIHAVGTRVYISTNFRAPNKRVIMVDADKPAPEDWIDIISEKEESIESVSFAGGYFFVNYLQDAVSKVDQYTLEGKFVRQIELPGIGSAGGFMGDNKDNELFYSFESFTTPYSIYVLNAESGESKLFKQPELSIDINNYETKQVFFNSKDGTQVPMFITAKKGVVLNAENPTLLYGYGGFNISLSPYFSKRWIAWLDMGGIVAVANLRGGGEYGEKWHRAGTQLKKQNVFDDFIAAAEYLQSEKYTSAERLTIMGGSNGGLLVGACMTQRPDLFKVALPAVGVLDMLRYHKFTAGAGWIVDYGCADSSKTMFEYLYNYSPVHNVKAGVSYPATMVTTGDHDDRVVPAHSFKFISELQDKHVGENPVLIRIETKGGHGAGKSTSMYLDELADQFAFSFYNMGVSPGY